MKKILIVSVLAIVSLSLFADSFIESSVGFGFFSSKETVYYGGESLTGNEKSTALTTDFTAMSFAEGAKFGIDFGLSVMFPLSQSVSGVETDVEFFKCNWCPRIGLAWRYDLNSQLTMLSAVGYELMMNFTSAYQSGITVHSSLFVHGLYVQDRLSYKMDDSININAGVMMFLPFYGSQKLSATGYGSEKYSITYSGILINPFIGIDIKRR